MRIIPHTEAQSRLQPHHDSLIACITSAWTRWLSVVAPQLPLPDRRTRPTVVHDFIADEVRQRFSDVPGVHLIQSSGRFLVSIDGLFLLHFKQITRDLRTRNYPTPTAQLFNAQQPVRLPNVPDVCRITVGYVPNNLTQSITAIYVFLQNGTHAEWSYELVETHRGELLSFPHSAMVRSVTTQEQRSPLIAPKITRIRRKKTESDTAHDSTKQQQK